MFSLFKKKAPAAPLWQAHEYLAVVEEGLLPAQASARDVDAVLACAKDRWDDLELGLEGHRPRTVCLQRSRSRGLLLGEVPTGREGVVLVVVLGGEGQGVLGHIVWDGLAAAASPTWSCPASGHEGAASQAQIAQDLARMAGSEQPFGVLTRRGATFMQVCAMDGAFLVEHQLVNPRGHYQSPSLVPEEVALALLASYLTGTADWMTVVPWRHDPL